MGHKLRVVALTKEKAVELSLSGLTPVGGKKSTGIAVSGLKAEGDYAVLSRVGEAVSLHPLRGAKGRPLSLEAGQVFQIDDLTIFVEREGGSSQERSGDRGPQGDLETLQRILLGMTMAENTKKPLEEMLRSVMLLCGHDQGLVISQAISGSYEILAAENLDASQSWLSESLIQHSLTSKKPVILKNVIGSGFDTRKSLMATKFLSVFCWPLVVQGVTVGALLTGSQLPYGGSFDEIKSRAEVYVSLAALVLDFHLRELRLRRELERVREHAADTPFLTEDAAMAEACDLARRVASSDLAVLVQGETGVGKEVMSRWIHSQSDRRNGPFVAVNCAAIPSELLESALMGHKRGAFTGAVADHVGKIQQAHGGTLFLDEIGDLPLALQSKLLRVLQDKIVEPVGSNKQVQVDVRLVCASHKNINELAAAGHFRRDLYYRIAQVTLYVPALRERLGDIRLLVSQFLKEIDPRKRLTQDAWSWVLSQSWHGNVREIKSAVKRAAILSTSDEVYAKHFLAGSGDRIHSRGGVAAAAAAENPSWLGAVDLETAKQLFVRQKIEQALQITSGNRTRAAELLGVTSRTLFRYLEQKSMTDLS